jgi:hypothetical protein
MGRPFREAPFRENEKKGKIARERGQGGKILTNPLQNDKIEIIFV